MQNFQLAELEIAAFNLLSQLCAGSAEGRKMVTSAPSFNACFDKALGLVVSGGTTLQDRTEGAVEETDSVLNESENKETLAEGALLEPVSLVEAAYALLASTVLTQKIQDSLICNSSFVAACFNAARGGSTSSVRKTALRIIARLSRVASSESVLTPESAVDLLRETIIESNDTLEGAEGRNAQILAWEGLFCVFDKLQGEKQEQVIQDVGKLYSAVVKNRSLSKFKTASERLHSAELAFLLTRIMLLALGNDHVVQTVGTWVIFPLVGTVQWRFDGKTTLENDEAVYWEACTNHSLLILATWLEQGKPLTSDAAAPSNLKQNIWMVARPGKAPRKAVHFEAALTAASKNAESSARLAAERLLTWLIESEQDS